MYHPNMSWFEKKGLLDYINVLLEPRTYMFSITSKNTNSYIMPLFPYTWVFTVNNIEYQLTIHTGLSKFEEGEGFYFSDGYIPTESGMYKLVKIAKFK